MTCVPPPEPFPDRAGKVSLGAILRIRPSPEYRPVRAETGRSPGERIMAKPQIGAATSRQDRQPVSTEIELDEPRA
jgi:hypothetical protein